MYHYFFACSDDSLLFDKPDQYAFEYQPNLREWGQSYIFNNLGRLGNSSTGLDPSLARSVTDFGEINRPAKRRYSTDNLVPYDGTIYVDRPVLVPGLFGSGYPLSSETHPKGDLRACECRSRTI